MAWNQNIPRKTKAGFAPTSENNNGFKVTSKKVEDIASRDANNLVSNA